MLRGLPEITPQEGQSWILCASLMTPRPRVCSLLQLQPQGGEHGDRLQSHCSAPECFHQEEGQVTDELNRTSRIWTVSASWVPDDTHVIRAATREAELTVVTFQGPGTVPSTLYALTNLISPGIIIVAVIRCQVIH